MLGSSPAQFGPVGRNWFLKSEGLCQYPRCLDVAQEVVPSQATGSSSLPLLSPSHLHALSPSALQALAPSIAGSGSPAGDHGKWYEFRAHATFRV